MSKTVSVGVLGGGAWGTALVSVSCRDQSSLLSVEDSVQIRAVFEADLGQAACETIAAHLCSYAGDTLRTRRSQHYHLGDGARGEMLRSRSRSGTTSGSTPSIDQSTSWQCTTRVILCTIWTSSSDSGPHCAVVLVVQKSPISVSLARALG